MQQSSRESEPITTGLHVLGGLSEKSSYNTVTCGDGFPLARDMRVAGTTLV
jgi:hypothetical protein